MIKWLQLAWIFFLISKTVCGQIKSGPMLGAIELRTAYVWCEVHPGTDIQLEYWKKGERSRTHTLKPDMEDRFEFRIRSFYLTGLEPGTTYEYQLLVNRKHKTAASGSLTTQELWKFRKPAPDFRFLAGSCAYFNEPAYDRPGRAYGGDSSIFQTMAAEPAAFMLWLGDNWYTREVDFDSEWGMWYRPSRDRSQAVLQKFW
ncbi:MAG TPA: hypothetical protein VFX48_03760, partial [Saprospiraceae bacterium]|nr:hypothetical protein [Saprospiraceae bacterium]